ncbi:TonB-dependent receptor [Novosphingobium nitrogenifigens DSM 19370]|uniref:TonB-dependent receptor n=1 Tax=Novosphingobium nitrogenifigens DSM 19370 TaxID=983920 RepID=F1Z604_9SPHN|nr:TonB-dependent receptor [Novosphingobium nitrogenifigens]EGD59968.1 TonB-dependent receptor [Novosphingobium nitrogenifigens DSM 19370]
MKQSRFTLSEFLALVVPSVLGLAGAAHAADAGDSGEIVVTSMRTPIEIEKVASSVTVLDAPAIEAAQPVAVSDILLRTPGITLARNGGYGEATSLRIRGADTGQTVVVVDGMRMADATSTTGGFDFSQLFTDDISHIEILRGPQSILWGSRAIGGIVNVTTLAPTRPLEGSVSVEAGSHQSVNAHAGLGGSSSIIDWRISGSAFTTQGIPTLEGGTTSNGYQRQAASGTVTVHISHDVSLDLRGYWTGGRNSYSDNYNVPGTIYGGDYGLSKQWSLYAGLNVSAFDGLWKSRLAIMENHTDNESVEPMAVPSLTYVGHGRIRRYEYQGDLAISRVLDLVVGAEREEERMAAGSPYDTVPFAMVEHTNAINSLYATARVMPVRGLTISGGVRYDHNDLFGGNTVFSAGGAYTPDGGTTVLRATYDQGFKAPSLYQMFSDYGVSGLRPEKAKGWEVGASRSLFHKAITLGAAWYERNSTNLITFAYCPYSGTQPAICYVPGTTSTRFGYYANVGAARTRGLELTGALRTGALFADGNYSIVMTEDRTEGASTYGQQLPRVPRHMANMTVGIDMPFGLTPSVAVRWAGASLDSTYSGTVLPGYVLADLRMEYRAPRGLVIFGRVENVADRHYQTALGYNSLGRTAWLGLRGHF